ncbi:MAG: RhuM family protein [Longimicrobiaceae bacterium]
MYDDEFETARGELILYETEDGRTRVECRFADETLWLSQALMAELFQVKVPTINEHLKGIFAEGEADPGATIRSFRIVRQEGERQVTRSIEHYSLGVILAVGYRVRSIRGTQFRRWATERLHEYLVKGFTLDDERLRDPPIDGQGVPDYFGELLERIRDIRASERRMYLRVREIFAMAADYVPNHEQTARFFQTIQNKLHFAVTGRTAAELIRERADHGRPHMGLTTWKGADVRKGDVTVAKNYLRDWGERLDAFLRFNERNVLPDAGRMSRAEADRYAEAEYERFAARRRELLEAEGERTSLDALQAHTRRPPPRAPDR